MAAKKKGGHFGFPGKIVEIPPPVTPFCFVAKICFFEFSEKKCRIFFSMKLTVKTFRNFFQ